MLLPSRYSLEPGGIVVLALAFCPSPLPNRPPAALIDRRVNLLHQRNRLRQRRHVSLIVPLIAIRQRTPLAILQPLLAHLVAAHVELPHARRDSLEILRPVDPHAPRSLFWTLSRRRIFCLL